MSYKNFEPHCLVALEAGSYFGDVSFIFQLKNMYKYVARPQPVSKIYSLHERYLEKIFQEFPEFKRVL